jgi:hypothetical protein
MAATLCLSTQSRWVIPSDDTKDLLKSDQAMKKMRAGRMKRAARILSNKSLKLKTSRQFPNRRRMFPDARKRRDRKKLNSVSATVIESFLPFWKVQQSLPRALSGKT